MRFREMKIQICEALYEVECYAHKFIKQTINLAEKYKDFATLVDVTQRQGSEEYVHKYLKQYGYGFAVELFDWYKAHGMYEIEKIQRRLIALKTKKGLYWKSTKCMTIL